MRLAGDDLVIGGEGDDRLSGSYGDDMLAGGVGVDVLYGGRGGSDTAFYGFYIDDVRADLYLGYGYLIGLGIAADIDAFVNIENLSGGFGDDELRGNGGANIIFGNSGNDTVDGREGDDTLDGGSGNDFMYGGAGDDTMSGGGGDDFMRGGTGADTLSGGTGADMLEYGASAVAVTVSLQANTAQGGDAQGDSISGYENLVGSMHDDALTGSGDSNLLQGLLGDDTLIGLGGNDRLRGMDGNDVLRGGSGDDTIDGMTGIDELTGGAGADRFFFSDHDDSGVGAGNRDVIKGFQQGQDKIYVGFDAIASTLAFEDFVFIGTDAFTTGVAGEARFSVSNGVTVISFRTTTAGNADFQIELDSPVLLAASDFAF